MPRSWLTVSALAIASLLAFGPVLGAGGADSAGDAPAVEPVLLVEPLDEKAETKEPLKVEAVEDLRFGKVVAGGGQRGEVVIDPATGHRTMRGCVYDLGGYFGLGEFVVRGTPDTRFAIMLPNSIEISGDGRSLVISNLTSSPDGEGIIGPGGKATVYVGGTLELRRNSPTGKIHGLIDVLFDHR